MWKNLIRLIRHHLFEFVEKDKYKKAVTVTKEINNLACAMSESKHKYYREKLAALRNEMLGRSEDDVEDHIEENPVDHQTQNAPSSSRMVVTVNVHSRGSKNSAQLPSSPLLKPAVLSIMP